MMAAIEGTVAIRATAIMAVPPAREKSAMVVIVGVFLVKTVLAVAVLAVVGVVAVVGVMTFLAG